MNVADLKVVLDKHALWLLRQSGGSRANLSGANLSRANLSGADLSGANLSRANLSGANLSGANLSRAYLSGADLSRANLSRANLSRAYLSGADLSGADLSRANLSGANLSGANLSRAYGLADSFLKKLQIVPEVGAFQAFKKAKTETGGYVVVHLEIPSDAARIGGVIGRKCRASKAVVLGFFTTGEEPLPEQVLALSIHDRSFIYRVGEEVSPTNGFSASMVEECAGGIHFFLTFAEAAEYC